MVMETEFWRKVELFKGGQRPLTKEHMTRSELEKMARASAAGRPSPSQRAEHARLRALWLKKLR